MQNFNTEENEKVVTSQEYSNEEKSWALAAHLSALAGFVIPFGNIFGPLLIWIIKREEFPFVADQGKEALNFQISITIYVLVSLVLILLLIGIVLLIVIAVFALIMSIIAAINAYDGKAYRYPLTIRFLK
ncbi:MAG: orotate phosphoribosyltransferase [Ignavibacteriae bacterium]|nr:MAG: orotate phosphoribosyltransferase [Ignavibacteriota bacterium]